MYLFESCAIISCVCTIYIAFAVFKMHELFKKNL